MKQPHTLVFDGYNMLHRARSGFKLGEFNVVFNFFRSIRSEIEKHDPTRVIFVLEGEPKRQFVLDPEYKANRRVEETDPKKIDSLNSFHKQKKMIIDLLVTCFPLNLMQHSDFEGDDLIYNVVKRSTRAVPITVVSSDTDFIQLLELENVKLYNPVQKKHITAPSYPYVTWKALRGDGTDNIKGIKGVGDKTAEKYLNNVGLLEALLGDPENKAQLERNVQQIRFHDFTEEETINVMTKVGKRDWDLAKNFFTACGFQSIVNDKSWTKFVDTFDPLF